MTREEQVVARVPQGRPVPTRTTEPAVPWVPSPYGLGLGGFVRIVQEVAQREGWVRALVNQGTLLYPTRYLDEMGSQIEPLFHVLPADGGRKVVDRMAARIEGVARWLRRVGAKTDATRSVPKAPVEPMMACDVEDLASLWSRSDASERYPVEPRPPHARVVCGEGQLAQLWATAPDVSGSFPVRRPPRVVHRYRYGVAH